MFNGVVEDVVALCIDELVGKMPESVNFFEVFQNKTLVLQHSNNVTAEVFEVDLN